MTLNQVISRLRSLAESHKQINHFDFCEIKEFLSRGDFDYVAVCVEFPEVTITRDERQTKFKFPVWICDKLNLETKSRQNETDLQSDLLSIAQDFIAMINSSLFYDTWTINTVYPVKFESEALTDYVVTVSFDIEIGIDYLTDRCQVPTDDPNLFIE